MVNDGRAVSLRRAADRGGGQYGWLDTRHTFSFAHYYDPSHMGFRSLRVINHTRRPAGARRSEGRVIQRR